jgi:hypothetical protein
VDLQSLSIHTVSAVLSLSYASCSRIAGGDGGDGRWWRRWMDNVTDPFLVAEVRSGHHTRAFLHPLLLLTSFTLARATGIERDRTDSHTLASSDRLNQSRLHPNYPRSDSLLGLGGCETLTNRIKSQSQPHPVLISPTFQTHISTPSHTEC